MRGLLEIACRNLAAYSDMKEHVCDLQLCASKFEQSQHVLFSADKTYTLLDLLWSPSPGKGCSFVSLSSKASNKHSGGDSHLLLIEDMARKLLMEDEVAAVLRHCTRVRSIPHACQGVLI